MKIKWKALLLIITFIFSITACDLGQKEEESLSINPPEWIIGNWSDEYNYVDYTFTETDVITDSTSFDEVHKEFITSQTSNDSKYEIIVETDDHRAIYLWEATSSPTTLNYSISIDNTPGPVIELTKE